MDGADQSCAGLIPVEQCVSRSWSWPHQTGTAGHIAGQWSGQRDCGFYWNTAVCVQRTWPNTHINCTKWEEEVFFFSLLSEICRVPGYSGVCIDFNLFHQLPSLPLAHSKQRSQVVRKKIYSTASVEKKKKKKKMELNWIELNWSVTRGLTQYIWCSQITGWCLGLEGVLIPESIWGSIFPSVWVNINKVWSLSDLFTPPRRI